MANNFNYYSPTEVVFGKGTHAQTGAYVKKYGGTKLLIVYGSDRVLKNGVMDAVTESVKTEGITYELLGGVVPNPHLSKVYEGIELGKKMEADFVLAVGGGSVIDTVKAISYGLAEPEEDVWTLFAHTRTAKKFLPVASVLTIAAAGSETSNSCVITKADTKDKRAYDDDISRPKFAIMNPELTYSLPPYQTSSGCVDIIMHTLERYFSHKYMALTDSIAASIIHTIMKYAKVALEKPDDYEARANIMWAGSLSHNGITGCGTRGDWATHMIEHELSGMFDVAHGAGLSAIWGSWARYVLDTNVNRFVMFAMDIMNITPDACITKREYALLGIKKMEAFFSSLNMPTSLHDLGIDATDNAIQLMAANCTNGNSHPVGSFRPLDSEDIKKILIAAK